MKILLVDDDAFLRDMYATKFQEAGHEVMVAFNGEEGLEKIEKEDFDVVLMDMVMPNMTGIEMINKVQKGPKANKVNCIVLSNQGEERDKSAAKEAGAIGYIVKAESIPSEVVAKVENLVK
ncbi:response regulator [bacterium]|nr:response regulator [bacterium]